MHCRTKEEAERLREAITRRLAECGLEVNLQKTKIVYCKDGDRKGSREQEKFSFLGYEFRPRRAKNRYGKCFVSFLPAISAKAAKAIRQEIRGWGIARRSDKTILDLARMFNPSIRGWLQYYGKYYRSMLHPVFRPLDRILVRWACRIQETPGSSPPSDALAETDISATAENVGALGGRSEGDGFDMRGLYEPRGSRPVLRARGGETPLRDSPRGAVSQPGASPASLGEDPRIC